MHKVPGKRVGVLKSITFCPISPGISTHIIQTLGVKGNQFDSCCHQGLQGIVGDVLDLQDAIMLLRQQHVSHPYYASAHEPEHSGALLLQRQGKGREEKEEKNTLQHLPENSPQTRLTQAAMGVC